MALVPPKGWEPSYEQDAIRNALKQYQVNPEMFDDEQVHDLETHASHFRMPFARSERDQEAFLTKVIKNLGKGFGEGFTTLPAEKLGGAEPTDTVEAIARNIGHLAGFVGYLPGGKWLPALRVLRGRSLPMAGATYAQKKLAKAFKPALQEAGPWAQKFAKGTVLSDMAGGAFHLGVASGISSWTEGIDEMAKSAGFGAAFGAVFRGIGNMPGFGEKLAATQLNPTSGAPVLKKLSSGQKADLGLRTLAGSMFQGLPSSMQSATTEEQVYNYLMGAFFGFKETPLSTRTSREFIHKAYKDKTGPNPEEHPHWEKLNPEMQEIVKRDFETWFGPEETKWMMWDIATEGGISMDTINKEAKKYGVKVGEDPVTGELFEELTPEKAKEIKEKAMEKGATEDQHDYDMHHIDLEDLAAKGQPMISFVERNLGRLLKDDKNPDILKVKIAGEAWEHWKTLHKPIKGTNIMRPVPNAEQKMKEFFYKKFGVTLSSEEEGWWRNFAERNRHTQEVDIMSMNDGEPEWLGRTGVNKAGVKKDIHFQPPLIQQLYERILAKNPPPAIRPFYTFIDHQVLGGKEYNLFEARRYYKDKVERELKKQYKDREVPWDKDASKLVERKVKDKILENQKKLFDWADKQEYYYLGGKGDNKRMYFVQYHPNMRASRKELKARISDLKRAYLKAPEGMRMKLSEFDKAYKFGLDAFKKDIYNGKRAELLYDKALVSNMMYDLTWNGQEVNRGPIDMSKVIQPGYINDAKGYNKRAQIWFNSGLTANESYIANRIPDLAQKTGKSQRGRALRFFIFEDPENPKEMRTGIDALLQTEAFDGGPMMRRDVVDALNLDKGLPTSGGVNKSFIVSPHPELGTMLGKYMFHEASPKLNSWMAKNNIHVIFPKSGIKQMGEREAMSYENAAQMVETANSYAKTYELPLYHIRTIMSELTSEKYIKPQRLAKQMFSTVSLWGHKDVAPEVFKDMFDSLSGRSFEGIPEVNEMMDVYKSTKDPVKAEQIINRLEELNLNTLLETMRNPEYSEFAQKAYRKILNLNDNILKELAEEGEITRAELQEERKVNMEFQGVIDRITNLYPEGNEGAYLHKWAKGYRMVAMRNYIVHSMTKPKIRNASVARMRPIDFMFNESIKNVKENEYFLDNGHKEKIIHDNMLPNGKMKLGDIFEEVQKGGKGIFKSPQEREAVKELVEAIVMRVPMDSMSGANVLQFKGFTNTRGFGIVLHPRTMRSLGGADLDGDKAHIYFGGEKDGMKKSWKKMYKDQEGEFIKDGVEMHNKDSIDPLEGKSYREQLIMNDKKLLAHSKTPFGYYDPYFRYFMSKGAAEGRDTLGSAVTNRANVVGAYNSIRGADKKIEWFVKLYNEDTKKTDWARASIGNGEYRFPFLTKKMKTKLSDGRWVYARQRKVAVFKVKTDDVDLERFRGMSRASVALGSDPMDEAGLANVFTIRRKVLDTLFDYEVHDLYKNGDTKLNANDTYLLSKGKFEDIRKYGLHNDFGKVNNLVYGKNHNTGRRHSYDAIMRGVHKLDFMPENSVNSLLPKLARNLQGLNWSDNVFLRIKWESLNQIYEDNRIEAEKSSWLKQVLGRKTVGTPKGMLVDTVKKHRLWDPDVRRTYAKNDSLWNQVYKVPWGKKKGKEQKYILGDPVPKDMFPNERPWRGFAQNKNWRESYLQQAALKGEDFIINDISDMVTLKRLRDVISTGDILESTIGDIFAKTEYVKRLSALDAKKRKDIPVDVDDSVFKDKGIGAKPSAKVDQIGIDNVIRGHKANLSGLEKELYDTFLIGTFQRSNLNKINEMQQMNLSPKAKETLDMLEKSADNTALSQAGLNSNAVSDANVKKFFNEYSKIWDKATRELPKEEVELINEHIGGKDKVTDLKTDRGEWVRGKIIEESDLDPETGKYLNEVHPFIGLERGKVKDPELREAYYTIKGELDSMHNSNAVGLNYLFRTFAGMNMNEATKPDVIAFARFLKSINTESFWKRSWDYMLGKRDGIKRIYYWEFPDAINRNLMRESPGFRQLEDVMTPYKDHLGNTIMGKGLTPMSPVAKMQYQSAKSVEMSMQVIDQEKKKLNEALAPYVASLEDGDILHSIAVGVRERGIKNFLTFNKEGDKNTLRRDQMMYEEHYQQIRPDLLRLQNKTYRVAIGDKVHLLTGKEVIQRINDVYTRKNEYIHRLLTGDPEKIDMWLSKARGKNGKESWAGLDKLRAEWTKYINKMLSEGKSLPIEELGIDGIRQISKRIMESYVPNVESLRTKKRLDEIHKKLRIDPERDVTGQYPFKNYFPHISNDRKVAKVQLEKAIDEVMTSRDMDDVSRKKSIARLITHHRQLTGDLLTKDEMSENFDAVQEVMVAMAEGKRQKAANILSGSLKRVGNQFSRTAHISGYDTSPEAYQAYMNKVIKAFYEQSMQVANRTVIHDFHVNWIKNNPNDAKQGNAWMNFMKLYAQSAMGHPIHIPEKVLNDPLMKIKGTPYKWFADNQTKKRIDAIRKQLGVGRKALKKWNLDEATIDELTGIEYGQLNSWSALEAKYQLASLLAHPKSSIANLYGGSVHSMIYTGVNTWRKARNFEYLKTHVNSDWKSMEDVERWLQKLGVQEEFLIYEAGLNPNIKSKRFEGFVKEASAKIRKDPKYTDRSLLELKRKYKLSDTMWNFAASFMRVPERVLRRDAFMASYLQAREKFGNAIKDYDNPFLIEMAKRGVKATQFLYSAPHRPMWTNSSLGRVFSRFQLWSWNSVRFRNDVIREARIHGYQPGTESFDRIKRMAQADLFMAGMSNLFMYSLFENALPAPWNWFQDTADWLMGDEAAKERAFYGSPFGPVQMITPPALRLLPPLFKGMVNDDYSKLTDYYLWTMMPFGRLIRDVAGPGGAIENPYYSVTKMTGLPILETGELFRGGKEEDT